ncbi:MAG: sce7726 family protein [Oscillospiraceae bacterium]|nr:sce7726 family protein [Oscillospiraceae bacterium]
MTDNSRAINRVFTRGVINDLLQKGSNEVFDYVVQRYVNDPESKTHGQIISEIYAYLGKEQRNEYYYMNTLLNKLLVGIHSVNTTSVLSNVRVGRSVADFVMINGEGKVYVFEVKSALDNFDRLHDQVINYFTAFSKVSVLSPMRELEKVERTLLELGDMGDAVGIYVLSDRDTIFNKAYTKEPQQFDDYLDHACIFKILRKREYENILNRYFGTIPTVAPVFHFRACLENFKEIPIKEAQHMAFMELKNRNKISKTTFEQIQPELKSTIYFAGLSHKIPQLEELLQSNYRR